MKLIHKLTTSSIKGSKTLRRRLARNVEVLRTSHSMGRIS
jgi:hypothetical protein